MENSGIKKQNAALLSRLIAIILIGAITGLSVFIYFNSALGWFAGNKNVSVSGMSVTPDGVIFPEMNAWRFDLTATSNGDEDGDALVKTGSWVNAIDTTTTTNPKAILPVVEKTYGAGESGEILTFRSLHLGTVDNLLTLSNDNCFYIRFDVTDELFQSTVGYSLTTSGIHVYDFDGNDQTAYIDALEDENHNSLNALQQFVDIFQVDAAVSSSEYTPDDNQDDIDALFYTGSTRTGLLVNNAANVSLGEQSAAYYIYIRFSPDLEKCFEATDDIVPFMPCEVTFDVTLTLTFT